MSENRDLIISTLKGVRSGQIRTVLVAMFGSAIAGYVNAEGAICSTIELSVIEARYQCFSPNNSAVEATRPH